MNFAFTPWVTSSFQQHGLTAMMSLVAGIVSGVSKLPLAQFINVCGRPQGFTICLVCVVLGEYSSLGTRYVDQRLTS
jgi:hypothetical protein